MSSTTTGMKALLSCAGRCRVSLHRTHTSSRASVGLLLDRNYKRGLVQSEWRPFSSSATTTDRGFLEHWKSQIQEGKLRPDKAQERVAKRLHRLQQALAGYSNEAFFVERTPPKEVQEEEEEGDTQTTDEETTAQQAPPPQLPPLPRIPRGLYIYGPVGTGKSLLMDTFYNAVDIDVTKKARYHFHAFMADVVHARIHKLNQLDLQTKGRNFSINTSRAHNPIVRVALQLSQSTTLLCLDEFQVTDVADAMILKQLFEVLWAHGTVVVATSNRPPSSLYEGGLNFGYFAPFIDLMERHCIVHSLESKMGDYRKVLSEEQSTILAGSGEQVLPLPNNGRFFFSSQSTEDSIDCVVESLGHRVYGNDTTTTTLAALQSFDLQVGFGRSVRVAKGDPNGLIGIFSFEELCESDLGSSDYRAIGQHFSIVALENVPRLSTYHHNRARRFITLIDELYEGKCALVCSTVDSLETADELFQASNQEPDLKEGLAFPLGETLGLEDVQTQGGQPVSTLASVRELSFAFRRAASRITEMTSQRWWNQVLREDGWTN